MVKKLSRKTLKPKAKSSPSLQLGSPAPDFKLLNQDGVEVSLQELRGKYVVVYFYPRAMTPGCTTQACGLRDIKKELANLSVVILGVSPDKVASLKKFHERDKLNFVLLSDLDLQVAKAYGSWGKKQFMGRTFDGILRQSFLLDKKGNLLHVISPVNTKTHAQEVLEFYSTL